MLRARLLDEHPERVPELHRRASDWYAANDAPQEAVVHALASDDPARAAELIERAAPAMTRARQEALLRSWLESLPDDLYVDRPVLTIQLVGARMSTGDPTGIEPLLERAERWLDADDPPIVIDERGVRPASGHDRHVPGRPCAPRRRRRRLHVPRQPGARPRRDVRSPPARRRCGTARPGPLAPGGPRPGPRPLHRVDHLLRGRRLPPGRHGLLARAGRHPDHAGQAPGRGADVPSPRSDTRPGTPGSGERQTCTSG